MQEILMLFKFSVLIFALTQDGLGYSRAIRDIPILLRWGRVPNRCSSSIGKTQRLLSFSRGIEEEKVIFEAPPVKKARTEGVKIFEPVPTTAEDFVSSFVTPTPKPDVPKDSGSTPNLNIETHRVSESVGASSIPEGNVGTSTSEQGEDNPVLCYNLLYHITLPGYRAALRNKTDARFLDSFNSNSTQHVCMVSELRLRYEHKIMSRERFQKKFIESYMVIQQRYAEIIALRAKFEAVEKESAEQSGLRGRILELDAEVVAKSEEITSLNKQNVELLGKVSTFKLARIELSNHVSKLGVDYESLKGEIAGEAKLREEFASLQDVVAWRFEEKSAKLDARIANVRHDMDNYLYPHMLTSIARRRWVLGHDICLAVMKCTQSFECHFASGKVISLVINKGIQQGLEARVKHGKTRRYLAQVEAYYLDVENKYVAATSDFENGDADSTPKLHELQSSLDQVTIPVYFESSGLRGSSSISHEMLLSDAIPVIRSRAEKRGLVTYSSITKGIVSVALPHDDLFDTTVLDEPANSKLKVTFLQIFNIPCLRKYVSAAVPHLICPFFECFHYFIRSFPFQTKLFVVLGMGGFVVAVAIHSFDMSVGLWMLDGYMISPKRPNPHTMLSQMNFLTWVSVIIDPSWISLITYSAWSGPTHRNHGLRNDLRYRTSLAKAYCLDFILIVHVIFIYVGSMPSVRFARMSPAPDPSMHDDPSVNRVYGSGVASLTFISTSEPYLSGLLAMKSAKTWSRIDVLG
nr:hypothetical protein [Tanacetum cinerariifolium]